MIESAVEAARQSLNKFIGENEKWANLHQGPNSIEIFWLELQLEKWLEILF